MRLPGFDMIFGLAAPAIDVFVEHASVAFVQIGDDEARVRSFRARFDAGDDPLDPAPALRAIEELLETTKLAVSGRGFETRLYAGFETFDMPAQRRSRRDAEDVIEAARPTPVENLGAAIMAVGAQQDLGFGPMGSDRAQQPAEEGFDLLAARPLGGTKHGGDEAALGVEQPQLLAAVDRVERVVDVERDAFGSRGKGLAIEIDHGAAHPQQGANVGPIFQPRDRRLRAQFAIRRRQIERHLEHRIASQTIGVVAVLIARRDHQQPKTNDLRQAVGDLIARAGITMQAASRSATPRRWSTSRNARTPPSDDNKPPSNLTSTRLPETGDNPGNGNIGSFMAGAASLKSRESASTTRF